jgi:uncharacterized membrane protein YfcA
VTDYLLICGITVLGLLMAYLRNPVAKALMLAIPIPVTLGILSVGQRVDVTNVAGLLLSLAFTLMVLVVFKILRVRILLAILVAAITYCFLGMRLATWLPRTEVSFWCAVLVVIVTAGCVLKAMPPREEPAYRSPLPVWLKTVILLIVVTCLVTLKRKLGGFLTTFPMLGVVASYETRKSLYTTSRQIPITVLAFAFMFGICHTLQGRLRLYYSLLPGLTVYAMIVALLTKRQCVKSRI